MTRLATLCDHAKRHACCWLWRAALLIPLLHVALHLLGVPHPEVISFLP